MNNRYGRFNAIISSLLFLCCVLCVPAAYGQEGEDADPVPDSVGVSDSVVIIGTRIYSAGSDAGFRAAAFALMPRSSAQDILRVVPGLVTAQHAGGGKAEQIFLRGFDADHGTDVNIRVDEAPVNMVSHGHGQGYADLHFIIPETIERVDVVKGPYFARYGDLTTAGAVSMKTWDSLSENLVRLEGGSFGTWRAVGLFRAPLASQNINAYFGGEVYSTQGYVDAPQNLRRLILFGKAHARIGRNATLSASISGFGSGWDASGQIPERAVRSGRITRFGFIDSTEGGATSRTTGTFRYEATGDAPFRITGSVTGYRFRLFSNFTFFAADSVRGDAIEQTDDRTILALKGERDFLYQALGVPMFTRVGADLRNDDITVGLYHDSARVRLETTDNSRIRQRHIGPFIEHSLHFPWGRFMLGLRADYFLFDVENLLNGGPGAEGVAGRFLLSPKANLAVPVTDDFTLFANSGFGFHSNDARSVVADPSESIPRAFGAEGGVRYGRPEGAVSLAAAAWTLLLEREFVFVGDEGTTEESGRTARRGIDLEVQANPFGWLSLGVDATLSQGRFTELPDGENRIPLAPSLTLTANALFRYDIFAGYLRLRHIGDRPANESNTVTAYGYSVVDLSASCRLGAAELFLSVENLLNTEWNEAQFDTESRLRGEAAPVSELHFTPGTPLSVRGGLAWRF